MQAIPMDMSLGSQLDGSIRLKSSFRDAHEHRAYLRALLLAKRLLERPELVARGRAYLERFVRDDPRQQHIFRLWTKTLQLPLEDLVTNMLSDDDQGAFLRETAPVFVVIPAEEVRKLAASSNQ